MDTIKIFNSITRKELLSLFFTKPDEKYYVRQLATLLNISAGTIHREVKFLEESGIIKSEKIGNIIFYQVDKNYHLFNEIKMMVFKTIGVQGSLKDIIDSIKGIDIAFIYGSYAKNRETKDSDVDLYAVGEFDDSKLSEKIFDLEKKIMREVNYSYSSHDEWEKRKESRDSFILGIIKESKIMLKGDEDEL